MKQSIPRRALVRALIMALVVSAGGVAIAADVVPAPTVATVGAHAQIGVYRMRVGDVEITALSDGTVPIDTHAMLTGMTPAQLDAALKRSFQVNPVETSINAYLVDTGSRLILVDTGAGDFFGPGNGGKLVASLAAAGVQPGQVDDILLTHVHTDHSGGLVHAGRVVFPKAVVHVGKADVDFFMAPENQNGAGGYDKAYFQQGTLSLAPYKASGQLAPFSGRTEVLPGITAIPAPGHTPGHTMYRLVSKGDSITFVGDLVHVEAVQMANPDVTIGFDVDHALAAKQRLARFDEFVAGRDRIAAAHLPFPGVGHLARQGSGYTFVPETYRYRE